MPSGEISRIERAFSEDGRKNEKRKREGKRVKLLFKAIFRSQSNLPQMRDKRCDPDESIFIFASYSPPYFLPFVDFLCVWAFKRTYFMIVFLLLSKVFLFKVVHLSRCSFLLIYFRNCFRSFGFSFVSCCVMTPINQLHF